MPTGSMGLATSGPGELNDTSSYLLGWAVPYLFDKHVTDQSLREEYTYFEADNVDFKGIDAQLNHLGIKYRVGTVVGHRGGDKIETLIELPASTSTTSIFAKHSLFLRRYNDLSLKHHWIVDPNTGEVTKTALEVSLCEEGAREGSHITAFYPSHRLLQRVSYEELDLFATRYNYPRPPAIDGLTKDEMNILDYDNNAQIQKYVNDTLWPLVRQRRQLLLKLSGYISASKQHKTKPTMSAAHPLVPAIAANSGVSANSTTAPVMTQSPPSLPPPSEAAKQPPVVTGNEPKTPVVTSPPLADINAMSVDAPPPPVSVAEQLAQIRQHTDSVMQRNAQLEAQIAAQQKQIQQAEVARKKAEVRTKLNMITGSDAYDERQRQQKQEFGEGLIETYDMMPEDKRDEWMNKQIEGLRACAKTDLEAKQALESAHQVVQQQAPVVASNAQVWPERDQQMVNNLYRHVMSSKNNVMQSPLVPVVGGFGASSSMAAPPPQMPVMTTITSVPAMSIQPVASDQVVQPTKRMNIGGQEGAVAMSKPTSVTSGPIAPTITQESIGWAGQCYQETIAAQSGQGYITVPTYAELQYGGFKLQESGVTRKSRDQHGNVTQVPEMQFVQRFHEGKKFGLDEWAPEYANAMIGSVCSGVMFGLDGKPQKIDFDSTVQNRLIATANEAAAEFKRVGRVTLQ